MNLTELLHLLAIEDSSELEYFEQYAELAETEDEIPEETLVEFFRDTGDALRELTDAYFEEMLTGVPDEQTELYLLITSIAKVFSGLAGAAPGSETRRAYAEEFFRFRHWYVGERHVHVLAVNGAETDTVTVLEALAMARAGNIGQAKDSGVSYDFSDALTFEVDEYMISLDALADAEAFEDDEEFEPDQGLIIDVELEDEDF